MTRFFRFVANRPRLVLLATALLTLVALQGIVDLRTGEFRLWVDPSINRLLPTDDPDVAFYEHVREVFGNDEIVLVALEAPDVFEPDVLRRVARITDRLGDIDGVDRVLSLSTALDIRGIDGDLLIESFLDPMPKTAEEAEKVRAAVARNPIYHDLLVAPNGRGAAMLVYFREISDRELVERGVDHEIRAILEEERGDLVARVTGTPIVKIALNRVLLRDLVRTLPLVFLVAGAVLGIAFRSARGVLVPVTTIGISLVWTLGFAGWIGWSLNLVTSVVPPLVVTVGFAYAIHVVSEYQAALARNQGDTVDRAAVTLEALDDVGIPVVITGLTTAAGFLSLGLNEMAAVREFGLLAVAGVVFTVFASLSYAPAVLCAFGPRKPAPGGPLDAPLYRAAERLAAFDLRRRRLILAAGAATLVVAVIGMQRIEVGTEYVENFAPDAPVRADYEAIGDLFSGSEPFYVILESSVPEAFLDPEHLEVVKGLQEWLEAQPEIATTTSFVDYLMLLHREMNDGDPEAFRLPPSKRSTKQIFMFGSNDEAWAFVDRGFQSVNIFVRARAPSSSAVTDLVGRVDAHLETLPDYVEARTTGDIVLLNRTLDDIVRGQALSIGLALFVIYVILAAMFTSLRTGLIALFPNILPIAIYFGALGLTGITLNPSTSLIACIALGIAVDDTVHYLARFNIDAKRLADEKQATHEALRAVIRPVTFTTLGLCLGFLVLLSSELQSQADFGALASFTLAVAWLVDVTVTPALASGVRIVTLWDTLTLDLGNAPQETIPLFRGLSQRQARIFALLSTVETVRAGDRLITEGDEGDEMFLIIDGVLVASLDRDGDRTILSRMERGQVVGEVALFYRKRSANVDAETDVRLLRFGEEDIARVQRRYPRIAATVLYNLNRVQAQRLVENTQRMD
ncbi:MAG: MMPL family transporter [Deltaproteobacteria bacterium]|nr:MMPL family transporter [Deltaproteobacteria bacterium]MBW2447535.1 MMPL family transporter [Deltaproteobacteria bacterium]